MTRVIRYAAVTGGVVLLLAALRGLPLAIWVEALVDAIRGAGAAGVVAYAGAYVVVTLLLLPASVLTAAAGLLYGPVLGTTLVSPVSVVSATIAFLLGRTVARGWIARQVATNPRFAAIDAAVGRNGFRIVTLLRLSPVVPFALLNYALGLTRVRTRDFVLGSLVGMLPATIVYVYLGSLVTAIGSFDATSEEATGARQAVYWAGLGASIVATVFITRIARRALHEEIVAAGEAPDGRAVESPGEGRA